MYDLMPTDQTKTISGKNKISIKDWAEDDRPRERLLRLGERSLSDAELLAIFINSGTQDMTAVDIAKQILHDQDNNLQKLLTLTRDKLLGVDPITKQKNYPGLGEARASTILAAIELGRRLADAKPQEQIRITESKHAYRLLRHNLEDLDHEEIWAIYLNVSGRVITTRRISSGGVSNASADIRLIVAPAIVHYASAIILAHNHPTGSLQPSHEDLQLTKRVAEAAKICGIKLHDHIIFGRYHTESSEADTSSTSRRYLSFCDQGYMNQM